MRCSRDYVVDKIPFLYFIFQLGLMSAHSLNTNFIANVIKSTTCSKILLAKVRSIFENIS